MKYSALGSCSLGAAYFFCLIGHYKWTSDAWNVYESLCPPSLLIINTKAVRSIDNVILIEPSIIANFYTECSLVSDVTFIACNWNIIFFFSLALKTENLFLPTTAGMHCIVSFVFEDLSFTALCWLIGGMTGCADMVLISIDLRFKGEKCCNIEWSETRLWRVLKIFLSRIKLDKTIFIEYNNTSSWETHAKQEQRLTKFTTKAVYLKQNKKG